MRNILLIIGLMSIISLSGITQNRSINFETGTFDEILKKAETENKIIMMDAYTTWCGPCKWMAKNVFTNDAVADYYNENFINAKFDMEKGEGLNIAKRYGVRAYPTILYLNGKGEKVHIGVGSSAPEQFIELGKKANDPKGNLAYLESQYEANKTNAEFLLKYLKVMKDGYIPYDDKLNAYWSSQKEEDLVNESNWNLINSFVEDSETKEFKYLIAHKSEFTSTYGEEVVEKKIYDTYMSKIFKVLRMAGSDHSLYFKTKEDFKKENYHREKELLLNTDLIFYKYIDKNSEKYTAVGIELFEKFELNADQLNDIAWSIYENSENKDQLNIALKMINKSLELNGSYASMDTKAAILFKIGQYENALKTEEAALKMAEEAGADTKSYKEMIEKIKSKM